MTPQASFSHTYRRARQRIITILVRNRESARRSSSNSSLSNLRAAEQTRVALEASIAPRVLPDSPDFLCDSGLGGMARWLRAAGYDARFWPNIDDDVLLERTRHSHAILLTTDRPLTRRSAVVWGAVPALLVPLPVGKQRQFRFATQLFGLRRKATRCMSCGGSLQQVPKEQVRDRIPPKTYPWRDEYHQCDRCGKLFWHGTHWQNVDQMLDDALG